jgi:tRNA/rRNA methyltransferase
MKQSPSPTLAATASLQRTDSPLYKLRVVLVRPRDPNNIGAVARAMKNFGFSELWVVAPHPPVWSEVVSAVNASDVLLGARVVATLDEAISDCNLVVGTGDCTRAQPEQGLFTPVDLSRELQALSYQLALVFGTEKHGLTNEDLSRCHRVLTIPTRPDCPSMNLGQAVAVCLYELTRGLPVASLPPAVRATAGASDVLAQLALEVLRRSGFLLPGNEREMALRVRASLLQQRLSQYDTNLLCGILRKLNEKLAATEVSTSHP